jgi:murein DD-endopeptidase MepM/ murein hydrolase activator NlpD
MIQLLQKYQSTFHPVVPFNSSTDKLLLLDFTENNKALTEDIFSDTDSFTDYVSHQLQKHKATYGIGGYDELRKLYARSNLFNSDEKISSFGGNLEEAEPRRLHLGIDIWGKAGTKIFAPLNATIHSFAFNNHYGDYGATIILQHQLENFSFHTLYGHLSLKDILTIKEGDTIKAGQAFAHFGEPTENGHWPPHLHFQIIIDMQQMKGDYPGVCKLSEREKYLSNCVNPDLILQMMRFSKEA